MFVRSPTLPQDCTIRRQLEIKLHRFGPSARLGRVTARLLRLRYAALGRRLVPVDWAKRLQFDVEVAPNL
jgi:hypothetical protein